MSKNNVIYRVCVYEEQEGVLSKTCNVVYETTKKSKAEAFFYQYVREHTEVCRAYIETCYQKNFDKRNFDDNDD